MKTLLIITSFILVGSLKTSASEPEQRLTGLEISLNNCYRQFPFFLEAIGMISDQDFRDPEKSQQRQASIHSVVRRSKANEVQACLDKIVQASKDEGDSSSAKYIKNRMVEIEGVMNAPMNASIGAD